MIWLQSLHLQPRGRTTALADGALDLRSLLCMWERWPLSLRPGSACSSVHCPGPADAADLRRTHLMQPGTRPSSHGNRPRRAWQGTPGRHVPLGMRPGQPSPAGPPPPRVLRSRLCAAGPGHRPLSPPCACMGQRPLPWALRRGGHSPAGPRRDGLPSPPGQGGRHPPRRGGSTPPSQGSRLCDRRCRDCVSRPLRGHRAGPCLRRRSPDELESARMPAARSPSRPEHSYVTPRTGAPCS